VPLVYGAYRRHRPWLERQGIVLAELAGEAHSLHAKLILMGEEEALLGSFNLDPRSLMLNTELMLHLRCTALCAEDLAKPCAPSRITFAIQNRIEILSYCF